MAGKGGLKVGLRPPQVDPKTVQNRPLGSTQKSTKNGPQVDQKSTKIDPQVDRNRSPDRPKSTPGPTKNDPQTDPKVDQKQLKNSTKKWTS